MNVRGTDASGTPQSSLRQVPPLYRLTWCACASSFALFRHHVHPQPNGLRDGSNRCRVRTTGVGERAILEFVLKTKEHRVAAHNPSNASRRVPIRKYERWKNDDGSTSLPVETRRRVRPRCSRGVVVPVLTNTGTRHDCACRCTPKSSAG